MSAPKKEGSWLCQAKNQHVVPHNGKWAVKGAGNGKATAVFDTQQQAYNASRGIARNQKTEVLLHGKNGQIRARETFGNDPTKIRDTEY